MVGGIAHDLNNLLTVVSGNLQLLEMSPTSASAGRWIAEALRASESGAALNERLLTFARRRRLEPTLTNLNDLVGSMVDMLHRSIGPSITVTTVLGADLGEVRIDPAEIENAILNLVLNARDAMPSGGRIVIETANADLDRDSLPPEEGIRPGEFVRLGVTDSGQGMSQEVKARAFEPFFTTKDVGRGSGLGLSTLHGFVRQSGGFVTLYSEVGHGTTVNVFLPRVESSGVRPSITRRRAPIRGDGQTILVVEDDADVRRVDREQLEALSYRVVTAANAADAMAALAAADRPIDLVFTDVIMPGGVSGLDLARRLVAADPARRILLTSGFAGDFIAGGNTSETEFPFLRKPHSLAELADAVADALRPPA
jgi:CheY-like chemotaxis protein